MGDPSAIPFCWDLGCPDRVQVGSGVSEVLAAFVTSLATVQGNDEDWTLQLDRRAFLLQSANFAGSQPVFRRDRNEANASE